MTRETMNVHKALAELKILDSRIMSAINCGVYCAQNKNYNNVIAGIPVKQYEDEVIRASYNKVDDLMSRYNAIKKAVTLSNAATTVEIQGKTYTIAEAIWMKNHGVEYQKVYLSTLRGQYNKAQASITKNNDALDKNAEAYVTSMFGSKESKTANAEVENAKKTYIQNNTMVLVDPGKIIERMETLEAEIAAFEADVDSAISVSNAMTTITVEY